MGARGNWFDGPRGVLAVMLAMGLLVAAACGGSETSEGTAGDGNGEPSTNEDGGDLPSLEQVYADVDGLEGEERYDRLVEMAQEEGGTVTVYTSDIEPTNEAHVAAWEEETGLEMEIFRESSAANLERLLQEQRGGQNNADTVLLNPINMWPAVEEGLCADLPEHLPSAEGIPEDAIYDQWIISQLALYLPVWNTDRVSEDEVPDTWQEVFDGHFEGTLGLEPTAWNRFAFIIQHIADEEGISVEEAIEMVRPGFQDARVVQGHSALQGMINTGELDISLQYQPVAAPDIEDGAPVSYTPPVTPIPAEGVGLCILEGAPHPATALLYLDWRLTRGMEIGYEATALVGTNPEYTPSAAETMGVDEEDVVIIPPELYDERDRWLETIDELIAEASGG